MCASRPLPSVVGFFVGRNAAAASKTRFVATHAGKAEASGTKTWIPLAE